TLGIIRYVSEVQGCLADRRTTVCPQTLNPGMVSDLTFLRSDLPSLTPRRVKKEPFDTATLTKSDLDPTCMDRMLPPSSASRSKAKQASSSLLKVTYPR